MKWSCQTSLDYISHLLRDTDVPDDEKLETIRGILELQLTDEPAHNHDHHHTRLFVFVYLYHDGHKPEHPCWQTTQTSSLMSKIIIHTHDVQWKSFTRGLWIGRTPSVDDRWMYWTANSARFKSPGPGGGRRRNITLTTMFQRSSQQARSSVTYALQNDTHIPNRKKANMIFILYLLLLN